MARCCERHIASPKPSARDLREHLDTAAADGLPASVARFLRFLGHEDGEVIELLKFKGSRPKDFKAANEAAGFKTTPEGYTWHHHQDGTTM